MTGVYRLPGVYCLPGEETGLNGLPIIALQERKIEPQSNFSPEDGAAALEEEDRKAALVCLACGRTITSLESKMFFGGQHNHTFFNPHGIVFELGCFSIAPGCSCHGQLSDEFSWFKGYIWEYALCGGCGEHLGWHYLSNERGADHRDFFGLIVNKIGVREVGGI